MNKQRVWMAVAAGALMTAGMARASLYSYNFTGGFTDGTTIADGNATGWTDNETISGIPVTGPSENDTIESVTVRLNLSGGYTGDLYGYLVLTDTSTHTALGFSTLLNRVGTGTGSGAQLTFGYADPNLNVTLSDAAANGSIHNYQDVGGYGSLITSGGAFQTDGGSLANFNGAGANNTWTLFLSDLSTGSTMMVNSWGLDITVVPEPVTWAALIFGALVAGTGVARRWQFSKEARK